MQLEDTIKLDVRDEWRRLKLFTENFETSRQNLRIAAIQLDLAVENASITQGQGQAGIPQVGQFARGTGGGNQGLNLLNALQTILNAQNDLIGIWVEYERNRINIYLDMDIMQIDERGVWIDSAYQGPSLTPPALQSEPADVLPPERAARFGGAAVSPTAGQWSPRDFLAENPTADRGRVRLAGHRSDESRIAEPPIDRDQANRRPAAVAP
jgi:hypothetical protein